MATHPIKIFYSWQSDLPNSTNRGFIEESLRRAARDVKSATTAGAPAVDFSAAIDRDVQGRLGASDIAATIFEKIASSDVFVADVSVIGAVRSGRLHELRQLFRFGELSRPTPNPNVLAEVGYAAGKLGWERVICVCNEHFGSLESLPFDLRGRSVVAYSLTPQQSKSDTRKVLVAKLKAVLEPLFHSAWQVHRPHPMRFAAYQDAALAANRLFPWLSGLFRSTRLTPPAVDWSTVLDPAEFRLSLEWARTDVEVHYAGDTRLPLAHVLADEAHDFETAAERLLSRYGERLNPLLYEALHRVQDSPLIQTLIRISDREALDPRRPRPRVLSAYVAVTDRDLRALQTIIEWCIAEYRELAQYDPDIRQIEPVGSGAPGAWRMAE